MIKTMVAKIFFNLEELENNLYELAEYIGENFDEDDEKNKDTNHLLILSEVTIPKLKEDIQHTIDSIFS